MGSIQISEVEEDISNRIKRKTLVDSVVDKMFSMISDGAFLVGEKIPSEKVLAKEFGVSRTTLREAFKKLENIGVISIRQGSGTYLLNDQVDEDITGQISSELDEISIHDAVQRMFYLYDYKLSHYLEAREVIETAAFESACHRATEADLLYLEQLLRSLESSENLPELFVTTDIFFHRGIIQASKNEFYLRFWDILLPAFQAQIQRVNAIPGMKENATVLHRSLLKALKAKNIKLGKEIIAEHLGTIPGRMLFKASEEIHTNPTK